jgi:hypothetical protein
MLRNFPQARRLLKCAPSSLSQSPVPRLAYMPCLAVSDSMLSSLVCVRAWVGGWVGVGTQADGLREGGRLLL